MNEPDARYPRPLLRSTRVLLLAFAALTVLAFVALFVLSGQTERTFAWTIDVPATAAFMGAGYASGTVLVLLALRSGSWVTTRAPMVTILVFATLSLVATLVHLSRLHLAAPDPVARFAGYLWLIVYLVVPVGMVVVTALQERLGDAVGRRRRAMPLWLRLLIAAEGAVMLVVGAALFLAPASAAALWPWPLTPLTARTVAAWLLAYGFAAALVVRDNDLGRLRVPAIAYAVFGLLTLSVPVRFPDDVAWAEPAATAYVVLAVAVALTGLAALATTRRLRRGRPAHP
ncbi:hypothetical protein [Georgenia sp. SYP-B2076]|uniref:hypothetical protein n=1 Tax=Georgenia sp. SYP-B2076 TaxID=2495881 RepID=UPI000F8EA99A|nr:hypothetical protein [Georgenia sp. SYP-B2076]